MTKEYCEKTRKYVKKSRKIYKGMLQILAISLIICTGLFSDTQFFCAISLKTRDRVMGTGLPQGEQRNEGSQRHLKSKLNQILGGITTYGKVGL